MILSRLIPVAVLAALIPCPTIFAQNIRTPLVPIPSINDFTNGDGWGVGLGLGVEYETTYEGSDEFGFELNPAGAVQWRTGNNIFFWAGQSVGWRGRFADSWLLQASIGEDEGREEGDSDEGRLNGLGDVGETTEIVLELRRALDTDWRYWLDGRILLSDSGNVVALAAGRRFGKQADGTGLDITIFAAIHDKDLANRDFGVSPEQSVASTLNEFELDAGLRSIGINTIYRRNINEHWQFFGEAFFEHFSGDIADSPISRSDFESEVGVGLIYLF